MNSYTKLFLPIGLAITFVAIGFSSPTVNSSADTTCQLRNKEITQPKVEKFSIKDASVFITPRMYKGVTYPQLCKALSLKDLFQDYPENWIEDYNYVKISTSHHGETAHLSEGISLTKNQQHMLQNLCIGADVRVEVSYKKQNIVTDELEDRKLDVLLTVVPDQQAQFPGGETALETYVKENIQDELQQFDSIVDQTTLFFNIDNLGYTRNIKFSNSTGDENLDDFLKIAIKNMPRWKPAQTHSGMHCAQEFRLVIGTQIGC